MEWPSEAGEKPSECGIKEAKSGGCVNKEGSVKIESYWESKIQADTWLSEFTVDFDEIILVGRGA